MITNLAAHEQNPADSVPLAGANITADSGLLTAGEKTLTCVEHGALAREEAATLNGLTKGMMIVIVTCAIGAIVQ